MTIDRREATRTSSANFARDLSHSMDQSGIGSSPFRRDWLQPLPKQVLGEYIDCDEASYG
jgi:hypothetical protein